MTGRAAVVRLAGIAVWAAITLLACAQGLAKSMDGSLTGTAANVAAAVAFVVASGLNIAMAALVFRTVEPSPKTRLSVVAILTLAMAVGAYVMWSTWSGHRGDVPF